MISCSFSDILDISIGLVTAGNQLNIHMKTLTTTLNIHVASTTMLKGCCNPDGNEVLNIRLRHMMLRGQCPRGIKSCPRFTGLDLLANELSAPLSFDMAELVPFISKLNLSYNKFSGKIPMSFSNCSYLNVLRLDHNQLTGEIPPELGLLNCIKVFSVSNNSLRVLFPFS
nr:putative inactive leucine-rich repeat receptor-like protein kinase [Quercus suber]